MLRFKESKETHGRHSCRLQGGGGDLRSASMVFEASMELDIWTATLKNRDFKLGIGVQIRMIMSLPFNSIFLILILEV